MTQNGKDVLDIHAISAWIRLGQKYQIDELVEEGLAILHEHYPDSLSKALSRSSGFSGLKAIAVVNLARLTGKASLLPTALLACCCLEAEIVKGFEREDGTRERLDPEDLGRCYAAKATLIRTTTASIVSLLDPFPPSSCEDPQKCEDQRRVNLEYLTETLYADICPDTLFVEEKCEDIVLPTWCDLCGPCRSALKAQIHDERKALWNELPGILDVAVDVGWHGNSG
ncbi:hypothetical protein NUW54_g1874 [Trametes sanguinea]|uniref:Uncharacterized protein n=1 Tax=Trametes sanguinea TaxID=158606 RepID=A0ACC1Q6F8_9APHY|nr:hypothetical protein NUW54_g1874 [Trametes sanguinea]